MRLDIGYRMRFRYAAPVWESQNEVRACPRDDDHQRLLSYRLRSDPPARVLRAVDYWGTAVDHVGIRAPHRELELLAEASVETSPGRGGGVDAPVGALGFPDFCSEHFEYLAPSEHVRWEANDDVAERASAAARGASSVGELVGAMTDEARRALAYLPGSTEIGISLSELLRRGSGVCQDFAHLAIGMLRSVGVPSRYVSGYLFAADETAPDTVDSGTVTVQTHAWIEVAVPGGGWRAFDPTNAAPVGERHVVIGHGRDYGDVAPVRGAFIGDASAEVEAEVVIGKRAPDGDRPSSTRRRPRRMTPPGQSPQQQQ